MNLLFLFYSFTRSFGQLYSMYISNIVNNKIYDFFITLLQLQCNRM